MINKPVPIGPRRKVAPVHRPDGFEPGYDAFEPRFASQDGLVLLVLGIERRNDAATPVALNLRINESIRSDNGPDIHEHGNTDPSISGSASVHFLYWKELGEYEKWQETSGIEDIFADRDFLTGDIGIWRELAYLSLDHNETSASRVEPVTGLANLADERAITAHHGYWGSARDRMVATVKDDLASNTNIKLAENVVGLGVRHCLQAPSNVCLIRSSQDLSEASAEQKDRYYSTVKPALMDGLGYLKNNACGSGCLGVRFLQETCEEQETDRTCVLGFFRSFADLEEWTKGHKTHHAIMENFLAMVQEWQGQPGLNLWHEITIFPEGTLFGDYVNCTREGSFMHFGRQILPEMFRITIAE